MALLEHRPEHGDNKGGLEIKFGGTEWTRREAGWIAQSRLDLAESPDQVRAEELEEKEVCMFVGRAWLFSGEDRDIGDRVGWPV